MILISYTTFLKIKLYKNELWLQFPLQKLNSEIISSFQKVDKTSKKESNLFYSIR